MALVIKGVDIAKIDDTLKLQTLVSLMTLIVAN